MPRRSDLQEVVQQFVDKLSSHDRARSRVTRARSGVETRSTDAAGRSPFAAVVRHSQAPQRSDSALSGSWLHQPGGARFRNGLRQTQGPAEGGDQEVPRRPSRKEGQEARGASSGGRWRKLPGADGGGLPPPSVVGFQQRARPARLRRFCHGDCGNRDTRVRVGVGHPGEIRCDFASLELALRLRWACLAGGRHGHRDRPGGLRSLRSTLKPTPLEDPPWRR